MLKNSLFGEEGNILLLQLREVITPDERKEIEAIPEIFGRNVALFKLLLQSSYDRAMMFRDVLISSRKEPLASLITGKINF